MNEVFQQRIEAVQRGRDATHAEITAKRNLREQLERDVAKFLANGGEIKQVTKNEVQKLEHGVSDTYKKHGCRCQQCVDWAYDSGLIKTKKLKQRKA